MPNTYLCEFDNCGEDRKLPILITDNTSDPAARKRFCCYAHAIGWLLRQAEYRGGIYESSLLAIQGIVRISETDSSGVTRERTFGDVRC